MELAQLGLGGVQRHPADQQKGLVQSDEPLLILAIVADPDVQNHALEERVKHLMHVGVATDRSAYQWSRNPELTGERVPRIGEVLRRHDSVAEQRARKVLRLDDLLHRKLRQGLRERLEALVGQIADLREPAHVEVADRRAGILQVFLHDLAGKASHVRIDNLPIHEGEHILQERQGRTTHHQQDIEQLESQIAASLLRIVVDLFDREAHHFVENALVAVALIDNVFQQLLVHGGGRLGGHIPNRDVHEDHDVPLDLQNRRREQLVDEVQRTQRHLCGVRYELLQRERVEQTRLLSLEIDRCVVHEVVFVQIGVKNGGGRGGRRGRRCGAGRDAGRLCGRLDWRSLLRFFRRLAAHLLDSGEPKKPTSPVFKAEASVEIGGTTMVR